MKKIIFFAVALLSNLSFSQILDSDNFNDYTIGNLGTQGFWSRDGGSSDQAKITEINFSTYGRSLSLSRTTTSNMWLFKNDFLTTPWVNRVAGNNIAVISADFYTGSTNAVTAASSFQLYAGGAENFMIGSIVYDHVAKAFSLTYTRNGNTAIIIQPLMTGFADNIWIPITIYYNYTGGDIHVKIGLSTYGPFPGTPGKAPTEVDIFSGGGALTSGYDNYFARAVNTATLNVNDIASVEGVKIKIYPNPASDYINVEADSKVKTIKLVDASGKNVGSENIHQNKIDVSSLEKGVYLMELQLEDGTVTIQKFIKK